MPADTYPLEPNKIETVSLEFKTTIVKFERSQNEQRSPNGSKPKITFRLTHTLDEEKKNILNDFFNEVKGSAYKFYFVNNKDGATYTVRFKEDKLEFSTIKWKTYKCQLDLISC